MKKASVFLVLIMIPAFCFADITIVESVKTGPLMGQPAQDSITTIYIKGNQARIEQRDTTNFQILDLATNRILIADSSKKEAMSVSLDMMKQAGNMIGAMTQNAKLDIKKTGNAKVINGFRCEEYRFISTGPFTLDMTQWVTQDVDTAEFERFKAFADAFMKMFASQAETLPKGMPIRSEGKMSMMGQNVTTFTEVQSISKDPLADSLFELPAGYQIKDMQGMMPKIPQN